jgi:hypothetical protein
MPHSGGEQNPRSAHDLRPRFLTRSHRAAQFEALADAAMQRSVREWRQVGISKKAIDDPAAEIMTIRR